MRYTLSLLLLLLLSYLCNFSLYYTLLYVICDVYVSLRLLLPMPFSCTCTPLSGTARVLTSTPYTASAGCLRCVYVYIHTIVYVHIMYTCAYICLYTYIWQGFSRLCAIHGGIFMLNTHVDEILFDAHGKAWGVKSGNAVCSYITFYRLYTAVHMLYSLYVTDGYGAYIYVDCEGGYGNRRPLLLPRCQEDAHLRPSHPLDLHTGPPYRGDGQCGVGADHHTCTTG